MFVKLQSGATVCRPMVLRSDSSKFCFINVEWLTDGAAAEMDIVSV